MNPGDRDSVRFNFEGRSFPLFACFTMEFAMKYCVVIV